MGNYILAGMFGFLIMLAMSVNEVVLTPYEVKVISNAVDSTCATHGNSSNARIFNFSGSSVNRITVICQDQSKHSIKIGE